MLFHMSVVGAIVLLFGGLVGLLGSWNAARPLIDPTRWYSPSWLPAMVTTELAPFWFIVHGAVLAIGGGLGGWGNLGGAIGGWLLVASMVFLLWIMAGTAWSVRTMRRRLTGPVLRVAGRANLIGRPIPTPPGVTEQLGVEWRSGLTSDITRPAGDERRLPVMVYVHGGGWTGGDPQRQARDMYHALALDGWVVVAIRYPFTPDVSVEHQIEVVKAGVRWVRTDLGEHGVDAHEVVLAGGSAGGHLATMAAITADHPDEKVDACVGIYGIYDMANRNGTRAHWDTIANQVMRATVSAAPNRYDELSPLTQITDRTPHMLVVHGTRDTLVPIAEAEQFVDALEAAGRPVEYVPVPGAQHAFDAVSSPTSRTVAAVIRDHLRAHLTRDR